MLGALRLDCGWVGSGGGGEEKARGTLGGVAGGRCRIVAEYEWKRRGWRGRLRKIDMCRFFMWYASVFVVFLSREAVFGSRWLCTTRLFVHLLYMFCSVKHTTMSKDESNEEREI